MKKLLCIALALLLLTALPLSAVNGNAETTPTFTISVEQGYLDTLTTRVKDGVTQYAVRIYFKINGETPAGITSLQFGVYWDPAKLSYKGSKLGSYALGSATTGGNVFTIDGVPYYMYSAASGSTVFRYKDDLVATLYFTISDTVAADEQIELKFSDHKSGRAEVMEIGYSDADSVTRLLRYGNEALTIEDGYIINGNEPQLEYPRGDVNLDKDVTTADAALILRYIVKLTVFNELQLQLGDLNGNGLPDSSDAAKILRWTVKLEKEL